MTRKKCVESFVRFGDVARTYGRQYRHEDFENRYPADRYRLDLVLEILKQLAPSTLLDVGCGTADPLVEMLALGIDAVGYDYADGMVSQATETLVAAGQSAERVWKDDMEAPQHLSGRQFACATALGVLYYARNFDKALDEMARSVAPGGSLVFSLRNELLSLFSLNQYSVDFYRNRLIPKGELDDELLKKVTRHLQERLDDAGVARQFKTIDDHNVRTIWHNPLTVERTVLAPRGLELEGLYFYHFHALPPIFEHIAPGEFRRLSARMEDPGDWRGVFMASAFVVHAKKPA